MSRSPELYASVQSVGLDFSKLTDKELIERTLEGEGRAFATIIGRYNQRLYRVSRAILADDVAAEDALQDAYLHAYAGLRGFRGDSAVSTWLTRIVINESLMARRRLRRASAEVDTAIQPDMASSDGVLYPGSDELDPEASAARRQVGQSLESAVDKLPPKLRPVYMLREIQSMTIEETAAELEVTPEVVKARLHRARRLLQQALGETHADVLKGAFPFLGNRCAGMAAKVLAKLGLDGNSQVATP